MSTEDTSEFKEELQLLAQRHLHREFGYAPIIGHPTLSFKEIDAVCDRLSGIRREEDLADLVIDRGIRKDILSLVYDFFRDIPEYSGDFMKNDTQRSEVYDFIVDDTTEHEDHINTNDISDYVNEICALDPQ